MTPPVASPPFQMDIRIAESPVVGMRFLLDGRATDIEAMAAGLDELVAEAVAQRSAIRLRLHQNEEARRELLADLASQTARGAELCFSEGMTLCAELGAVEERIAGLRGRIEGLHQEAAGLRRLSADLVRVGGGDLPVDLDVAYYNRAVRQMHGWVDADQDRIAQAVSDGPLQHLDAAAGSIELVVRHVAEGGWGIPTDELARCTDAVRDARHATEVILDDLRAPERGALIPALRRLAGRVHEAQTRLIVIGEERVLPPAVELAIHRIAQEAVANAVHCGHAGAIDVVLSLHRERVILLVQDDGEGFDAVATEARLGKTRSFGLIAMRQRAALAEGAFEVRSMVGAGTEVRATFRC